MPKERSTCKMAMFRTKTAKEETRKKETKKRKNKNRYLVNLESCNQVGLARSLSLPGMAGPVLGLPSALCPVAGSPSVTAAACLPGVPCSAGV